LPMPFVVVFPFALAAALAFVTTLAHVIEHVIAPAFVMAGHFMAKDC